MRRKTKIRNKPTRDQARQILQESLQNAPKHWQGTLAETAMHAILAATGCLTAVVDILGEHFAPLAFERLPLVTTPKAEQALQLPTKRPRKALHRQIERFLRAGYNYSQTARLVGTSRQTVARVAKRMAGVGNTSRSQSLPLGTVAEQPDAHTPAG